MTLRPIVHFFVFVLAYFAMSWFFPWEGYFGSFGLALGYFFDFFVGTFLIVQMDLGLNLRIRAIHPKVGVLAFLAVVWFFSAQSLMQEFGIQNPFDVHQPLIIFLLLIVAPFIEEYLYRQAFYRWLERRIGLPPLYVIGLTSILFSIAHLPGYWILPSDQQSFALAQMGYTFVLGLILGSVRHMTQSVVAAMGVHLLFNATFLAYHF